MKTIPISGLLLACLALNAQTINQPATGSSAVPGPTLYAVVSRDANSAVWQRQSYDQGPNGTVVTNVHRVVELATGLNHLVNGQYVPSTENIVISADGSSAMATNGQHQVYFPGNIYSGVIKLVTPDGKVLQSQPVGLSYSDGTNSVLLAVVTNSTGAILPSGNQVIYTNAFAGLDADLIYTYTKAGMEQDVVLRQQPPDPGALNLNASKTRLQMITEFVSTSSPGITATTVPTAAGNLEDDSISFGVMHMIPGRAFLLGTNSPLARVAKHWQTLNGRQFLIEEVPIVSIAQAVNTLSPFTAQVGLGEPVVSKNLVLPPQRLVQAAPKTRFLALAAPPSQGLALDYPITFSDNGGNYVFQGDSTYYISGAWNEFSGTFTFEGGAVLKYAQGASLNLIGGPQINWQGSAYRPVVFTAKDDDSVGEPIPGSTGNPGNNRYANPALTIGAIPTYSIDGARFAYEQLGLFIFGYGGKVADAQFVNCQQDISAEDTGTPLWIENALFSGAQTVFSSLYGETLQVQNSTIANCNCLESGQTQGYNYNTLILTNCILANMSLYCGSGSNYDSFLGDHNGFYYIYPFGTSVFTCSDNPFQTAGAGNYYLNINDPNGGGRFHNVGSTSIDPTLLNSLTNKTTQPPSPLTNCTFSVLTLNPVVQRDIGTQPDLGYHYDPLDYMVSQVTVQFGQLSLNGGVALGLFGGTAFNLAGGQVNSTGTPQMLNRLADCLMVQEEPITLGGNPLTTIFNATYGPINSVQARFTDISVRFQGPTGYCFLYYCSGGTYPVLQFQFQDCWLRGVTWDVAPTTMTTYGTTVTLWNNLFDRSSVTFADFGQLPGPPSGPPSSMTFSLQNNLFHGGFLLLDYDSANQPWSFPNCPVYDNAFDNCEVYAAGNLTSHILNGNNGYVNTGQLPGGTGNVPLSTFNYAAGPLGNYYQQSGGFVDKGHTTADQVGLFHYTTQINQVIEGNSIVDIGFHYVALDHNGNPPDTGVPGVPDYMLDPILPTVSIVTPANSSTFNTSRINVTGTFTDPYLKQITVNGVVAYVSGNTFEAMNVPLAAGANTITATAEDIVGKTATTTITVTGSATPVDPVQLQGTPIAGFVSLNVNFTVTANVPGTLQQVLYDFNGDGVSYQTAYNLNPVLHTYSSAGEYFPVVTIVTTAGSFSSSGGWNSIDPNRLRIDVQLPPVQLNVFSITDPVDLKCDSSGNLYVLSQSTATITEYNSGGTPVRSLSGIGTSPSGLDVDGSGNVYVADTGDNQVLKFNPTTSSFQLDTTFGTSGHIGKDDKSSGSGNGQFNAPFDVAVSPDVGTISVSDSNNHRIQQFATTEGTFLNSFGQQGGGVGQFNTPKGLTYDSVGYLYIVDSGNNRVVVAFSSTVIGTSGTSGTGLGQFQGAINLGVGDRGIYVADTGNNRIQSFEPAAIGDDDDPVPFIVRGSLSSELSLNQPDAAATVEDLLEEKIYIADTGNNRVILVEMPTSDPVQAWNSMVSHIDAGDIPGGTLSFSSDTTENYLNAFCNIGINDLASDIDQIGPLTPVFIKNDTAQYYFERTIDGQLLLFPVDFVKENGVWKILDY